MRAYLVLQTLWKSEERCGGEMRMLRRLVDVVPPLSTPPTLPTTASGPLDVHESSF